MDERSRLQNNRKDTLDSIKGLDEAEKNVNDLNNKDDKDIASGKEAEKAIDDLIAKNFKDAKLPISINNIKDASRKKLRKNLKSTVYEGKRFAGLRSFVMGTFKKTAYKKLRQICDIIPIPKGRTIAGKIIHNIPHKEITHKSECINVL